MEIITENSSQSNCKVVEHSPVATSMKVLLYQRPGEHCGRESEDSVSQRIKEIEVSLYLLVIAEGTPIKS